MDGTDILNENWNILTSFFPENWRELGRQTGAITRLRDFKSEEQVMRTLLIHIANGYSLREAVVLAKAGNIANVSDVALLRSDCATPCSGLKSCVRFFCEKAN